MVEENERLANDENQVCLRSFKTHWAEAQIDGPMQAVGRYDDLAKLLITIGGFVLAMIAGGYSAMLKASGDAINKSHAMSTTVIILGSMLAFFVSAAMVCVWQPKPRALQSPRSLGVSTTLYNSRKNSFKLRDGRRKQRVSASVSTL